MESQLVGYWLQYNYYYTYCDIFPNTGNIYIKYLYDENDEVYGLESSSLGTLLLQIK